MEHTLTTYEVAGVRITETEEEKIFRSENYNMNFNKKTGYTEMWGRTYEENPVEPPFNSIMDIEITTICKGPGGKICPFCYHSNGIKGKNMSFEVFKGVIDKQPYLCQVALGADAHGVSNPDMFKMMHYARSKGIVPNLTIADVSDEVADELANVAGAVAVSVYHHAGVDIAYELY